MRQQKLEEKVKELLGREGFKIDNWVAKKQGVELDLGIYSSEKYNVEDIDYSKDKIFVDKSLEVEGVYVIEEEKEYDLPSFEIIGDIAIINDLAGREKDEAVEGIRAHHSVKTILLKTESLSGEYRVGGYERLYGEETETIHREHGYRFKIDPTQAYFSERFSTERKRIMDQVEEGDKVLVMFAGVGPFAILCADKAEKVVAVEKNPAACNYLKENVELNGFEDKIEVLCGDVGELVPEIEGVFDRVIMPLPESAIGFLDVAAGTLADRGLVHLYSFVEDEDFESVESNISSILSLRGMEFDVLDRVKCGYKSPSEDRYCFDILVLSE